ncbi:tetratricopeptide repeat protein [uncultured Paludibaculum sp.]|uniref:tetratricopeptide repeat protein n=1 Tax=uncultured Paludibaculum sp. TaxID=1765020 RepID=UPI002AAB4F8F|nr:tetratricopeptide repeat protein [uncultured Paludibaculum sp.]
MARPNDHRDSECEQQASLRDLAFDLLQRAFQLQQQSEFELAAELFRKSIEVHPTAEAHTFLGWTYHAQGRIQDAIAECRKAIEIDPDFGNPYNDTGAYLIELGRPQDAIPWLERATTCTRYYTFHYPWYNLGRAYTALELFSRACECFQNALDIEPGYALAQEALERVRRLIQ